MINRQRTLISGAICLGVVLGACSADPAENAAGPVQDSGNAAQDSGNAAQDSGNAAQDSGNAADVESSPTTTSPSGSEAESTAPDPSVLDDRPDPVSLDDLLGLDGEVVLIGVDGEVVVTAPDGSARRVLSSPGTVNSQPTWSTSGDRVAWSSFGPDGATLSISASDGSVSQSIPTSSPAFYLSWSPDETWVGGLRPTSAGMEMFVTDVEAETDRQVSQSQPFYFDWADDDAIVANVGAQLLVDISASNAATPLRRALNDPLGAFQAPTVLPGGDVLGALIVDQDNALVRLSGTTPEVIATADAPMLISASPDGQRVAVLVAPGVGGQEAESQVIQFQFDEPVELDAGRVTTIDLTNGETVVHPEEQVVSFSWSPDGETLAKLSLDGTELHWSFSTPNGEVDGASFFPSSRFSRSYLPFFDQYNLSATAWAPTSDALVFAGSIGDESGVFVDVITDDLGPALISEGEVAFWSPR